MIVRFDARYLTLALMILSAIVVVAAGWFVLSVFLGMAHYIRSL